MERHRHPLRTRLALTGAVLATAGTLAVAGTWASFTATASVDQGDVTAGTVTIAIPAAGASNRLTLGATGIVPGDTLQRAVDLQNTGNQDLASIVLDVTAPTTSLLDTDATNGLQVVIERCSVAWTEAGSNPAYTYTCGGTTSSVVASRPVVGSAIALSNLSSLTAGATDHLRVTLSFPSGAGNTFQGVTSALTWTFTATQRAGAPH